jgi:hypothetical protein
MSKCRGILEFSDDEPINNTVSDRRYKNLRPVEGSSSSSDSDDDQQAAGSRKRSQSVQHAQDAHEEQMLADEKMKTAPVDLVYYSSTKNRYFSVSPGLEHKLVRAVQVARDRGEVVTDRHVSSFLSMCDLRAQFEYKMLKDSTKWGEFFKKILRLVATYATEKEWNPKKEDFYALCKQEEQTAKIKTLLKPLCDKCKITVSAIPDFLLNALIEQRELTPKQFENELKSLQATQAACDLDQLQKVLEDLLKKINDLQASHPHTTEKRVVSRGVVSRGEAVKQVEADVRARITLFMQRLLRRSPRTINLQTCQDLVKEKFSPEDQDVLTEDAEWIENTITAMISSRNEQLDKKNEQEKVRRALRKHLHSWIDSEEIMAWTWPESMFETYIVDAMQTAEKPEDFGQHIYNAHEEFIIKEILAAKDANKNAEAERDSCHVVAL